MSGEDSLAKSGAGPGGSVCAPCLNGGSDWPGMGCDTGVAPACEGRGYDAQTYGARGWSQAGSACRAIVGQLGVGWGGVGGTAGLVLVPWIAAAPRGAMR